ncbi:MAG: hypothetical protein JWM91_1200 [Rhodospirillales bacterium]|nr:hypothetical protein [Rhodospirillales bacterium]
MSGKRIIHRPELRAEIGRLHDDEGMAAAQIAAKLSMELSSVSGIMSALYRALELRSKRARDTKTTPRKCLTHGGLFESEGPRNRICPACSHGIKYGGMGTAADLGCGRFSSESPVSGAIMARAK